MSKIICIDPGHGGYDSGSIESGLVEKNLNILMAKSCAEILKYHDITVNMTRESDIFVDIEKRKQILSNTTTDIFISFHHDSYDSMKGITQRIYGNTIKLNEILSDDNSEIVPFTRFDKGYLNIFDSTIPSVVIENVIINNKNDGNYVDITPEIQLAGKNIAIKILEYLNIPVKPDVNKNFSNEILYVLANYGLTMRSTKDISSVIIDNMDYGDSVLLLETIGSLCKIKYNNKIGYVNSDYLSESRPNYVREAINTLKIGLTFRDVYGFKMGTILYNEKMKVYEKIGDMYKINYNGITGYVKSLYLKF